MYRAHINLPGAKEENSHKVQSHSQSQLKCGFTGGERNLRPHEVH